MQFRRLGGTDLQVSAIGLGALEIGAKYGIGEECGEIPDEEAALDMMRTAVDAGITLFDTAGNYGISEYRIGRFLARAEAPLIITTKLNILEGEAGQWLDYATQRPFPSIAACIDHQVRRSLANLGVEAIDVMQWHGLPAEEVFDEATEALQKHVEAGRIRFLGASCGGSQIPRLMKAGAYSSVQLSANMLDQRERNEGFALAKEHDLGVLIRSPLALGVLAGRIDRLDEQRRSRFEPFLSELAQRLPEGMSVPEAASKFLLAHDSVTSVLCGTRRPAHIRANAQAGDGPPLPEDVLRWLHELADRDELPQWSWAEHYEKDWPSGANEANLELCRSVDIE